ncbi:MAG: hypothetical protein K9L31_01590 [Candidatus Pacebacteria bacterium]|nr:hypothetical protein [Candidatus Paceibacterota bacterium]
MSQFFTKQVVTVIIVLIILSTGTFIVIKENFTPALPTKVEEKEVPKIVKSKISIIGKSTEGRLLENHSFGNGPTSIVFVGGIHGGYEWNSVFLAYKFIDYLDSHSEIIPDNLTVSIIPSANPDGLYKVTGKDGRFTLSDVSIDKKILESGRFNANDVDINRNFDCKWKPSSTWRSKTVSAGTEPFSEPESKAIRNFMIKNSPSAVVFWHSQSNNVFASQCENGILQETLNIMNIYSKASEYQAVKTFDAYEVTGAVEDWLASVNIPAITVELKTHETIEWEQNLSGVKALIVYFTKNNQPVLNR